MYITNIWGIFFSVCIPIIMCTLLTYYAGIEEGRKNEYKKENKVI